MPWIKSCFCNREKKNKSASPSRLIEKKEEVADQPNQGPSHAFRCKTFKRQRPCHFCHQPILNEGYCCRVCKYVCHKECGGKEAAQRYKDTSWQIYRQQLESQCTCAKQNGDVNLNTKQNGDVLIDINDNANTKKEHHASTQEMYDTLTPTNENVKEPNNNQDYETLKREKIDHISKAESVGSYETIKNEGKTKTVVQTETESNNNNTEHYETLKNGQLRHVVQIERVEVTYEPLGNQGLVRELCETNNTNNNFGVVDIVLTNL